MNTQQIIFILKYVQLYWNSHQGRAARKDEVYRKYGLMKISAMKYVNQNWLQMCVCVCVCACAQSLQSCPNLCNPMDYSPPGSSIHGILQARILECIFMSSSRRSSQPRSNLCLLNLLHCSWILYPLSQPGSPLENIVEPKYINLRVKWKYWKVRCLGISGGKSRRVSRKGRG